MDVKQYIENVLVGLDQLLNAVFGGDPDMTVSGRMGRAISEGRCVFCRFLCRIMDVFDKGHCLKQAAREADEGRHEVIRW